MLKYCVIITREDCSPYQCFVDFPSCRFTNSLLAAEAYGKEIVDGLESQNILSDYYIYELK